MDEIPVSVSVGSAESAARALTIGGRRFDLTLWQEPGRVAWHWTITAPGVLALSGDAASEPSAVRSAYRAGLTLARLVAA